MIRMSAISVTLICLASVIVGPALATEPPAQDELRRTIEEVRQEVHELRQDIAALRRLLENRADTSPATRHEMADLVEQYNKLVKQEHWAEAELVAKQAKELDPHNPVTVVMYEKARLGRQFAQQRDNLLAAVAEEYKADGNPPSPDCTIADLDAATRLQAAASYLFPRHPAGGRMETELELLKLARVSRYWSKLLALRKNGKNEEFGIGCQKMIEAFPESDFAQLALDELATAARGGASPTPTPSTGKVFSAEQAILAALKKPISLELTNVPLITFVRELQKQGDVNIVVDNAGIIEAGKDFKTPVSVHASGITLAAALKTVLEPLGLHYMVQNGVLLISSRWRCNALLEVRIYPVADLVTDANTAPGKKADFGPLVKLITTVVSPSTWEDAGGRGHIAPYDATLSLVILQTRAVHQKTSALLQTLRSMRRDISLDTVIIDRPPVELLKCASVLVQNDYQPEPILVSETQTQTLIEGTHRFPGTTQQRVKLLLRFGAIASIRLEPRPGETRREAITIEATTSNDHQRVGLSAAGRELGTGRATHATVETTTPDRQPVVLLLKRKQDDSADATAGRTLLIIRPQVAVEEEEYRPDTGQPK